MVMPSYQFHENLATVLPDLPADSILSKVIRKDAATNITLFKFDAGQSLTEHTASAPAILHIIEGQATLTLGADSYTAEAGAWAYMEAHLPHSIDAITPLTLLLILIKTQTGEKHGNRHPQNCTPQHIGR